MIQRRGPADIMPQQAAELGLKRFVGTGLVVLNRQLIQGPDQRFRNVAAADNRRTGRRRRERGSRASDGIDFFTAPGISNFQSVRRTETRPVRAASGKLLVFDRGERGQAHRLLAQTGGRAKRDPAATKSDKVCPSNIPHNRRRFGACAARCRGESLVPRSSIHIRLFSGIDRPLNCPSIARSRVSFPGPVCGPAPRINTPEASPSRPVTVFSIQYMPYAK